MRKYFVNYTRTHFWKTLLLSSLISLFHQAVMAENFPARKVPARMIPLPTDVSPQLQKNIALPLDPLMYVEPKTMEQWREVVAKGEGVVTESLMKSATKLFTVDVKAEVIGGVKTRTVIPNYMLALTI